MLSRVPMLLSLLLSLTGAKDVLFSMPVTIDGIERTLSLHSGETAEGAAWGFAQAQGYVATLAQDNVQALVSTLSSALVREIEANKNPQPLFELEVTVDATPTTVRAFAGQTLDEILTEYFTRYGFSTDARTRLWPQILAVLRQEVERRQAKDQGVVFSLPIVIGRDTLMFEHRVGQELVAEAKAWVQANILPDYHARVYPEVLRLIQDEVRALEHGQRSTAERPTVVLRVPVTIDQAEFLVSVYEGYSIRDSAIQFLRDQGITDEATALSYLPALIQVIEKEVMRVSAQQQASETKEIAPMLSIPLLINQKQVQLEHFENQSPETSALAFAQGHGLDQNPDFEQTIVKLSALIRDQLTQAPAAVPRESMFAVPITLNGTLYEMNYYEGDEPEAAANNFCLEHQALISQSETDEMPPLGECTSFLAETVTSILNRLAQESESSKLFDIDIDLGNDQRANLEFYAGQDPERVAQHFCDETGISTDNLPSIIEAIRERIANL